MKKSEENAWKVLLQDAESRQRFTARVKTFDTNIGSFSSVDAELGYQLAQQGALDGKASPLGGLPFAVKDNIALSRFPLTCASKVLSQFASPYTATAVQKLLDVGAVPIGKTNLDEFGMGSGTEYSVHGVTVNPWDTTRVPGGSSGGSAAAVAAGMVPFALGSDTGGSVRQPANFCGLYGLKPTYGAVSRYGLVAYASSLECIGVLARTPEVIETVFTCIKGADPLDQTSREDPEPTRIQNQRPLRIGMIADTEGLDEGVQNSMLQAAERFRSLGATVEPVSLESLSYVVPAYYTIAAAEASANLARYTGIRYGHRSSESPDVQTMTRRSREEGFGQEVKLRILLGTYVLRSGFQDQYYLRAQKIRTSIRREISQVFSQVDLLMMPVYPTQAFLIGGKGLTPFQQKLADRYTAIANLAGIPALSIPGDLEHGIPSGVQLLAPEFCEHRLFDAAKQYHHAYPAPELPGRISFIGEELQ
ncbi:MAG: Asp-tRNA(Asn)/Glu-tRNA(Gln) amidotransferase subunit GatA [Spirochaetota bacterium]